MCIWCRGRMLGNPVKWQGIESHKELRKSGAKRDFG